MEHGPEQGEASNTSALANHAREGDGRSPDHLRPLLRFQVGSRFSSSQTIENGGERTGECFESLDLCSGDEDASDALAWVREDLSIVIQNVDNQY